MSRPHNFDMKAALLGYCTAFLLSLGMSLTLLRALLPQLALWPACLFCAGFTLVFCVLFWMPLRWKWALPAAAVAMVGVWAALGGGPGYTAVQLAKAAFLSFRGVTEAAAPYADTARWLLCLVFSLAAAALAWDDTLPLALFMVLSVVGLSFLFSAQADLLLCALPAAAGLLLMLAEKDSRRPAVLPVALALTALAFLLLPGKPQAVSPFRDVATRVRQFVEDYLLFSETRTSFTLADEGYQPLDQRLGGPANPANHHVMDVTTGRTVLLRGRTYNDYSGLNWYDTLSARRYLYVSPRFTSLRDELLDLNRPLSGDTAAQETIHIHMLDHSPTTLFAPARTRTVQLESERMVLYYNLAAELFLTRDLAPGDTYTLTYVPYAPGDDATEQAISACAALNDPHYAEAAESYLTVPRHIQQEIYDMAAQATAGCETPYEKALGIQDYLRSHFRYSLNVQSPPEGVDFVAWFLIAERQGYCTYFASAMTILCRIAGLPARYVTGYLAVPDETGVATVTGQQAHAWTEVYLNGFGWLDFDATPRSDNDRGDPDRPSNPRQDPQPPATPTPSPSAAPTPSPSPAPTSTPEPAPGQEAPTPTPAPPSEEPGDAPTPPPAEPPEGETPPEDENRLLWWILLAILALLLALLLRYWQTEPLRRAARHPAQAAGILFAAVCALLALRGVGRKPQETLHDFAKRADDALGPTGLPSVSPLAHAYAAQIYGNHPARIQEFQETYRTLRNAASPWARFRLTVRRMFTRAGR